MTRGYLFPKMKSVDDESIFWHGCKLSEEVGEVCQGIAKRKPYLQIAEECMDVIQCCENLLRKMGMSDGSHDHLAAHHQGNCEHRGYYVDEDVML